jgi:hypothetical protein
VKIRVIPMSRTHAFTVWGDGSTIRNGNLKIKIVCGVTQCSLVDMYQSFGGKF